jgi:hypothetical protein
MCDLIHNHKKPNFILGKIGVTLARPHMRLTTSSLKEGSCNLVLAPTLSTGSTPEQYMLHEKVS